MDNLQKHKKFVENLLDRVKNDDQLWDNELDGLDKISLGTILLKMVINNIDHPIKAEND